MEFNKEKNEYFIKLPTGSEKKQCEDLKDFISSDGGKVVIETYKSPSGSFKGYDTLDIDSNELIEIELEPFTIEDLESQLSELEKRRLKEREEYKQKLEDYRKNNCPPPDYERFYFSPAREKPDKSILKFSARAICIAFAEGLEYISDIHTEESNMGMKESNFKEVLNRVGYGFDWMDKAVKEKLLDNLNKYRPKPGRTFDEKNPNHREAERIVQMFLDGKLKNSGLEATITFNKEHNPFRKVINVEDMDLSSFKNYIQEIMNKPL